MSDFENILFEPKKAPRETWDLYHAYRRARQAEIRPDDPIAPDDIVETRMKMDDPFNEERQYLTWVDGKPVGGIGAGILKPNAPGYDSNKQFIWAGGGLLQQYRRRGIGRSYLQMTLDMMKEWDKTVLTVWGVEEEDGIAFMDWVGAEVKVRFKENRLDFSKIDWDLMQKWISAGLERNTDMKIELLEDKLPPDFYEEYSPILSELLMTMPFDDLDHGEIVVTPETLAEDQRKRDELGSHHHTVIVRTNDGRLAAMTDVSWNPAIPTHVGQRFTGVHPDFRGRGLGKLIKAYMVDFLRNKYEGVEWIVTGNANSNDPMLAINTQMGFFLYRQSLTYQMTRDELDAFLKLQSKESANT